jgi:hypothetical protein
VDAEVAEENAMSLLDLLATLEGSGQTELGIFSSSAVTFVTSIWHATC